MATVWVFPAYAGMSRWGPPESSTQLGFPRLRGDEPPSRTRTKSPRGFSPPTRG